MRAKNLVAPGDYNYFSVSSDSLGEISLIYLTSVGYIIHNNILIGPNIDLSGVDLSGVDLSGVNLSGTNLSGTNLSGANLSNANLSGANLNNADLNNVSGKLSNINNTILPFGYVFRNNYVVGPYVNLRLVDLSNVDLSGLDISGADLSGAVFANIRGKLANISGAILEPNYSFVNNYIVGPNVNLANADMSGFSLSGANLSGANLSGTNLSGTNLSEANLSNADLSGSNLSEANLSGANLNNADLNNVSGKLSNINNAILPFGYVFRNNYVVGSYVNLRSADLSNVDLSGLDISGADLSGAVFANIRGKLANISGAILEPNYSFVNNYIVGPNVNLANADMSGFSLSGVNLSGVNLSGVNLSGANLSNIIATNTNLSNIIINNTVTGPLVGTPLNIPENYFLIVNNLSNKYLIGPGTNLTNINLTDSDLSGVDLSGCNISNTDLSGINFMGVKMGPVNGTPINLDLSYNIVLNNLSAQFIIGPGVIIDNCDLTQADLSACNLKEVKGAFNASINPILPSGYLVITNKLDKKIILGDQINNIQLDKIKANNTNITNIVIPQTVSLDVNSFINTNLSGSTIQNNNIDYGMFFNSNFTSTNFTGTVFNKCVFINCTVSETTIMTNVIMNNCYISKTALNTLDGITFNQCTYI